MTCFTEGISNFGLGISHSSRTISRSNPDPILGLRLPNVFTALGAFSRREPHFLAGRSFLGLIAFRAIRPKNEHRLRK